MGRFNLLREPWINVVCDDNGTTKLVSLIDIFNNNEEYLDLAGDTKTQDFALLRILLAVLHTVLSRFNSDGDVYDFVDVDERYKQISSVNSCDINDYKADLLDTWVNVWNDKKFPKIICEYLYKWEDRFFLFDEKYPFMQVRKYDIRPEVLSKPSGSKFSGKTINRLISESANKQSLFSPKNENDRNLSKEILSEAEIARWLITLHGYIGLSDKVIFGEEKYKASKGWLFDIGGVYLKGNNLFETLMLNCYLPCEYGENLKNSQRPAWEMGSSEKIKSCLSDNIIYNISELYTAWSRAIYINPDIDIDEPFYCEIVKLPEIIHKDNLLEPMTLWNYNGKDGDKDGVTPKKHIYNQSLWRSFGLLTINEMNDTQIGKYRPGIINWLQEIKKVFFEEDYESLKCIKGIMAVSMESDGNATSWLPIGENIDFLSIQDFILTDVKEGGWTGKINDIIQNTKETVEKNYKNYLRDIARLRGLSDKQYDSFITRNIEAVYFEIDKSFRRWLIGIKREDDKKVKENLWKSILQKIVIKEAKKIYVAGGTRDFVGIEANKSIENIAVIFNKFMMYMNVRFKKGGNNEF